MRAIMIATVLAAGAITGSSAFAQAPSDHVHHNFCLKTGSGQECAYEFDGAMRSGQARQCGLLRQKQPDAESLIDAGRRRHGLADGRFSLEREPAAPFWGSIIPAGRVRWPRNVLQYLPRQALQLAMFTANRNASSARQPLHRHLPLRFIEIEIGDLLAVGVLHCAGFLTFLDRPESAGSGGTRS